MSSRTKGRPSAHLGLARPRGLTSPVVISSGLRTLLSSAALRVTANRLRGRPGKQVSPADEKVQAVRDITLGCQQFALQSASRTPQHVQHRAMAHPCTPDSYSETVWKLRKCRSQRRLRLACRSSAPALQCRCAQRGRPWWAHSSGPLPTVIRLVAMNLRQVTSESTLPQDALLMPAPKSPGGTSLAAGSGYMLQDGRATCCSIASRLGSLGLRTQLQRESADSGNFSNQCPWYMLQHRLSFGQPWTVDAATT